MKKIRILVFIIALFPIMASCSDNQEVDTGQTENNQAVQTEIQSDSQVNENSTQTDNQAPEENEMVQEDVIETDYGMQTMIKSIDGLDEVQESGPFTVKVSSITISELEPNEYYTDIFDNKEKVTRVSFYVEVENKSEETNSIHPDQGKLLTNTKEQVDADLFASNQIGGEFMGNIVKEGEVIFHLDSPPADLTNLTYVIDGPYDSAFDSLGEDISFDFSI